MHITTSDTSLLLLIIADSRHALPCIASISILGLECCAVAFSTAKLGTIAKFQDLHVVPDNSTDAMYICSLLLASCNDEATQFKQE